MMFEILRSTLIEFGVDVKDFKVEETGKVTFEIDFSEHDKKVAEENDKKIAELEKENSELRKEIIEKNRRMIELINEVTEEREEKEYYKEKLSLLRTRCMEESRDDFDADRYGSLVIKKPEPSYEAERIAELQDRHQSDCIRISQLLTTIDVLTERYQKLREVHGL